LPAPERSYFLYLNPLQNFNGGYFAILMIILQFQFQELDLINNRKIPGIGEKLFSAPKALSSTHDTRRDRQYQQEGKDAAAFELIFLSHVLFSQSAASHNRLL
jgi:hypothetical protein